MTNAPTRCFIVWFPDWPVTAWRRSVGEAEAATRAVAIVTANRVVTCSLEARLEGVRCGQKRREAQAGCPELLVVPADPGRDQRLFDPFLAQLEELTPGVQPIRAGLVAIRARGLARYHGDEVAAATHLIDSLAELGVAVRIGIADGVFTAEQAAYAADPVRVVPPSGAAAFLAPLPIDRLGDEELSRLLPQLGVRTLGEFARLPQASIRERFGERGVLLHHLASGADRQAVTPRTPPVELARQVEFEPPLDRVDQVGFSVRRTASDFIANLASAQLVCTELSVIITGERGEVSERVWLHPAAFTAAAVVDRVRWQLEATTAMTSPVVSVRLAPVACDAAFHHEPGLFGTATDERVHHALSRIQALLGHDGVVTATIGGGRWLAERQVLVPWGDRVVVAQPVDRPWPGHLPAPLPAEVFVVPRPVDVFDAEGQLVQVDERGRLSAAPILLTVDNDPRRITGWAGPWAIDERTWDAPRHRRAYRFQVVDTAGQAWLLVLDHCGAWWAEGRYD
ncbi:MAG: DNA polymerase Y family protein [Propionibacteriaceae bacterium]|jgi:protein ImuB|nr:DNA polymerase Y family protein [Propionibacteriaceae bacterium]